MAVSTPPLPLSARTGAGSAGSPTAEAFPPLPPEEVGLAEFVEAESRSESRAPLPAAARHPFPSWDDVPAPRFGRKHSMSGRVDGVQLLLQSAVLLGLFFGTILFLIGTLSTVNDANDANDDAPRKSEAPTLHASG